MIVSAALGQHIIPEIQAGPQLDSVYVFCDNRSIHEQWARTISKVKGVYTEIEPICKALQIDCGRCDQGLIPISFRGIDPLFMYTQLLKETFLEIDDGDDDKSVKELIHYCRQQGDIKKDNIDKFEQEYHLHDPIWWYTGPYFLFTMLNRGLRLMDVDVLLRMSFFIRHLHRDIEKLHREQQSTNKITTSFQVFRGGLMSFNNFLSTSLNRGFALEFFARPAAIHNLNSVGILFVMAIDSAVCATSSIPFADYRTNPW
ncbi:unnamed protein product [Rotaria sp. Silwood1]|nr:unnamed protein product [Rotaria sp. Silwood1]CAF5088497.1 unnamed protein product [Rotaria sp. Silwood1]